MLSEWLRLLGVMVMADARSGLLDKPERSVTESLPSCVAVPSRKSWTKYGPQRRATIRELTGIRSPPMHKMSMSDNSRISKALSPSSSLALEWARPPAVYPAFRVKLRAGPE